MLLERNQCILTLLYPGSGSVVPSRVPARTRDGVVRDV
ncbi:hypothetical protein KARMA_0800 [Donghicola eburneus]|uniref:Uncharacterized protein n=1 Tax=Donghicola eburneus TaxID=393278 RepID=A0A1M4MVV8_9RHOB|nr:hypothetical protein KARMA_0800 [Donghicola eburneus]